jgi:hypothetical protein
MRFHDAMDNGEPEPRASAPVIGSPEAPKNAIPVRQGNAGSMILHRYRRVRMDRYRDFGPAR